MTPGAMRTWLMRQPRPARVVADDKVITIPNVPRPWPEVLETVLALRPERIQCQTADGTLIRARDCKWSEDGSEETAGAEVKGSTDLQVFAKLLAEGYEKGSKSYEPLINASMQFCQRQAEMLAAKDKEIAQLRQLNTKLQAELLKLTAAPASGDDPGIMGALMSGVIARQMQAPEQPAPAAPNGKAKRA